MIFPFYDVRIRVRLILTFKFENSTLLEGRVPDVHKLCSRTIDNIHSIWANPPQFCDPSFIFIKTTHRPGPS